MNKLTRYIYRAIEEPLSFDAPVLISALRISSAYDYPALRAFTIVQLEALSLAAVERILLAREFQLANWENLAYEELCNREEAITREEARALGIYTFSEIASIREERKVEAAKNAQEILMRETFEREIRERLDEQVRSRGSWGGGWLWRG